MTDPQEVLGFWLDEIGSKQWFQPSASLDDEIKARFEPALAGASEGRHSLWLTYPSGTLAYIILTDQFSRNMYRGKPRAFATDRIALAAAKSAIDKRWDFKIDEPARQFFYLPLMHSENLVDQERCVRLICERMPEHGPKNLLHARAHRSEIREFGRFPARNEALGRVCTAAEHSYLAGGGYASTLRTLEKAQAA